MNPCDPVTLEIIRGAIRAAQGEMEALLERTAISAFIREKKDFYTALFDADGVMAVGSNVPIFGDVCRAGVRARSRSRRCADGDLYWYNDCYGSDGAVSATATTRCSSSAGLPRGAPLRLRDGLGALRRHRRPAPRLHQPGRHRHLPGRDHHPAHQADRPVA